MFCVGHFLYLLQVVEEGMKIKLPVEALRNWEKLDIIPKHKLQKNTISRWNCIFKWKFNNPVKPCIYELNDLVSVGNSTMVTPHCLISNSMMDDFVEFIKSLAV